MISDRRFSGRGACRRGTAPPSVLGVGLPVPVAGRVPHPHACGRGGGGLSPGVTRGRVAVVLVVWLLGSGGAWGAEVKGSVVLEGQPPPVQEITIQPKKKGDSLEGCGSLQKASPRLRVAPDGGVQDAVVWVEDPAGGAGKEGPSPLLLDQKECVFSPHVAATAAGGSVKIRNSDRVIHNIRIFREGNPSMLMHQWQKPDAADIVWRFPDPGRYVVRCGVHPWMYGWVFVAPQRAVAVTDGAGRFTLAGVPPGRHTLQVWHETLGALSVPVEVGQGEKPLDPIRFLVKSSASR